MLRITREAGTASRSQNADGSETGLVHNLFTDYRTDRMKAAGRVSCATPHSFDSSMRSVENCVLDVTSQAVKALTASGVEVKTSNISIIESLAWIFINFKISTFHEIELNFISKEQLICMRKRISKKLRRLTVSLTETLKRIQEVSNESYREYSYVKYWLDYYLCRMANDPSLPERKEWNTKPLFHGYCERVVRKAYLLQSYNDQRLILSLQKGSRKIWSNIDGPALIEKDADFKARLCCKRGLVSESLKAYLILESKTIFSDLLNKQLSLSGAIPSARACWQAPISKGGAQSLFSPLRIPLSIAPPLLIPDLEFKEKTGLNLYRPDSEDSDRLAPSPPESIVDRNLQFGKLRGLHITLCNWLQSTFNDAFDNAEYGMSVSEELELCVPGLTSNRVARITEAGGKIRYVSCGDGYTYTALRPLQSAMLKCWKRQPESTMLQDDLLAEVRRIDEAVKLPFWNSVDYEAATDLLKRDSSFCVLEPLLRNNVKLSYLAWMSFGPGVMVMPDKSEFVHQEGQLMGHVLSFPMLCTINLAVYHAVLDRWVEEDPLFLEDWGLEKKSRTDCLPILRANVKVNGDDMLFKCTKRIYEIFLTTCKEVGFKLSQGKNYLSRNFCVINSQFYCRHSGQMDRIGYLNLQLVKGFSSKKGESSATPADIGQSMNKMIEQCPKARRTLLAALSCAEKKLDKATNSNRRIGLNRSWFGHIDLGGYGVNPMFADSFSPTREQRKLGAMMKAMPWLSSFSRTKLSPRMMNMINTILHPVAIFVQGPPTRTGEFPKFVPTPISRSKIEIAGGPSDEGGLLPRYQSEIVSSPLHSDELNMIEMKDSKWFSRLLFYGQAAQPPFEGDLGATLLNSFHEDHRLKPMSARKYKEYRSPVMLVSPGPDCPPLPPLLIKNSFYGKLDDESFDYFTDFKSLCGIKSY